MRHILTWSAVGCCSLIKKHLPGYIYSRIKRDVFDVVINSFAPTYLHPPLSLSEGVFTGHTGLFSPLHLTTQASKQTRDFYSSWKRTRPKVGPYWYRYASPNYITNSFNQTISPLSTWTQLSSEDGIVKKKHVLPASNFSCDTWKSKLCSPENDSR